MLIASLALVVRAEGPPQAARSAGALSLGAVAQGALKPGPGLSHSVVLPARSCGFSSLRADKGPLMLQIRSQATGRLLQRAPLRAGLSTQFDFCTYAADELTFELSSGRDTAGYQLRLEAILPRKPAPGAPAIPRIPESPRLRALWDRLAAAGSHPNEIADEFWRGVSGAPLIEPAAEGSRLVTFLWRGDANTQAVELDWPAWSFELADHALLRLGGSDVWYRTLQLPAASRLSYRFVVDPGLDGSQGKRFVDRNADAAARADPLNPRRMRDADDPHPRSVLELPEAGKEIWLTRAINSPRGRLERHKLASDWLGNEHELDVYLPAGYGSRSDKLPLLIVFDGESYVETLPGPRLLDGLIGGSAIPPLLALFVRNATRDSRSWELPCNPDFAEFLARELLPWLRAHYRVRDAPEQVALAGSSFGGIAATCAALRHPELFGKVLSQSGAYWWTFPRDARDFDGSLEPGWIGRRFAAREPLPLRFYLSAGTFERAESGFGILETVRGFRDVLKAKGYAVDYREFAGGHDHLAWRADLPEGLIALFGKPR